MPEIPRLKNYKDKPLKYEGAITGRWTVKRKPSVAYASLNTIAEHWESLKKFDAGGGDLVLDGSVQDGKIILRYESGERQMKWVGELDSMFPAFRVPPTVSSVNRYTLKNSDGRETTAQCTCGEQTG